MATKLKQDGYKVEARSLPSWSKMATKLKQDGIH